MEHGVCDRWDYRKELDMAPLVYLTSLHYLYMTLAPLNLTCPCRSI